MNALPLHEQLRYRVLLGITLAFAAQGTGGCTRNVTSAQIPSAATIADTSLGPGDAFEVRVFGEKDLSGDYQVASDGTINFPLIGVVAVKGKESHELAGMLAGLLKEQGYLRDPHVTVRIRDAASKRVSVIGAVAKPGTLPLVSGMTLVQAVSQAGGFTPLASKDDTVITRRVEGKIQRYRVSVTAITRGEAEDLLVGPGDIIFVPERVF